MRRFLFALLVSSLAFGAFPSNADAVSRMRPIHQTYSIVYDKDLEVRTDGAPPSEVKAAGRPLTRAEQQALRDRGKPGYRATLSDLTLAMYITIYLEKVVIDRNGNVKSAPYPPILCLVHHNRLSQRALLLYHQYYGFGIPPIYVIGQGNLSYGIPLPNVRLKMVLVHLYNVRNPSLFR